MTYYKKLADEEEFFSVNYIPLLKEQMNSINTIQKRLLVLLKRKNRVDFHDGVSTEETMTIEPENISTEETMTVETENISTEETITVINNPSVIEEINIEKDEMTDDEITEDVYEDTIENILGELEDNNIIYFKVLFKNGDIGWIEEFQISEEHITLWKEKKLI